MSRKIQRTSPGRKACGVFALLSCSLWIAGCGGEPEGANAPKFDPGKEAEQKKIADQHDAVVAKQREYMLGHIPAGTPTGPPPSKGK